MLSTHLKKPVYKILMCKYNLSKLGHFEIFYKNTNMHVKTPENIQKIILAQLGEKFGREEVEMLVTRYFNSKTRKHPECN